MEIVEMAYRITSQFPTEERFSLVNQINRSAVSIPSNIAEGSGRTTNKDFLNFLNIALSSSFELETQMILANRLFHVEIDEFLNKLNELQKMIVGFKKTLNS
jgi:four helix bundle protein